MAVSLDYQPGATPLDSDEAVGLIPSHITTHGQLNQWELVNIVEGERRAQPMRATTRSCSRSCAHEVVNRCAP